MEDALITACSVSRDYLSENEVVHAVRSVSLELKRGELVLIRGRSGSGKTTLLNLLGGLETPSTGQVFFRGRDLASFSPKEMTAWRRRQASFVFQAYALVPELTAWENVDLPLRIRGVAGDQARDRALAALESVGLAPRAQHRTNELSGGEQQRVALARGLVTKSNIVFADEPTGELDQETTVRVAEVLRKAVEDTQVTIVMTSHDPVLMERVDRTFRLEDGELVPEEAEA